MAYANITYTGNGTNRNFTIPFQYLLKDHVFVYVGGVLTTAYTYVTANTIQLDVAPANGVTVLIKRVTPIDTPIVDYVDGSTLQESLLDATALQNLFASQEAFDAASLLVLALDGAIDAANKRIKNVATPVAGNDAVTKDYVDVTIPANLAAAAASAAAADASAAAAANSAANAGNFAVDAFNSKNAAAVSETNAAASAATAAAVVASKVDTTALDTLVPKTDIGVSVQAFDANTAKTNVAQNFTLPQRSALLTDNDGSFDLAAKQNFKCTTAGAVTLTFTNQADGLSGSIIFVNAGNHTVSAHANTKLTASDLAKLSGTGTYRIDYLSDGTNAYCSVIGSY